MSLPRRGELRSQRERLRFVRGRSELHRRRMQHLGVLQLRRVLRRHDLPCRHHRSAVRRQRCRLRQLPVGLVLGRGLRHHERLWHLCRLLQRAAVHAGQLGAQLWPQRLGLPAMPKQRAMHRRGMYALHAEQLRRLLQ